MKKTLLLILAVCFCFGMQAQEVSTSQWTHVQKRTADWCPMCGTWGWDFKEELIDKYSNESVLVWSAHHSGGLANETSEALASNYGGSGQPLFFVDGANIQLNSGNGAQKLETVQQSVDLNSGFPAFYGSGATATYDGTVISVTAKAELFEASGDSPLHLGLYLMRKETVASQASRADNSIHKNLVVNHFGDEVFGQQIVQNNGQPGEVYEVTAQLELPNEDISNYSLVSIIWSFIDGKYQFANANINEISMVSSTSTDLLQEANVAVTQVSNTGVQLAISSTIATDQAQLAIYDLTGQMVTTTSTGIVQGDNAITVNTPTMTPGMYIVNLAVGKKNISERFVVR